LNVSGATALSSGTITGKILMNGTVVNDYSLQIKKTIILALYYVLIQVFHRRQGFQIQMQEL
jgi:hypothetical protein